MATGFPTKANWAAGDVLTAAQMDDLAGTVNLFSNASATTGSQLISNAAGTSFAYSATPSASNPVLNSAMNVWQRSTSVAVAASTNAYTADRWQVQTNASTAITVARYATSDTTNLPNIQYCARFQRNSGQTGTGFGIAQSFETINSVPFAGKQITYSFYARAGADFSPTSKLLTRGLIGGTGTDQNFWSGYTGQTNYGLGTVTLTTTWQRFTVTDTIGSTITELAPYFNFISTGTAGANDYCEITGIQIDVGSVALPFRTYAATYQAELAACRRYLPAFSGATGAGNLLFSGYAYATNNCIYTIPFDTQARVAPTGVTVSGTINAYALNVATAVTPTFNAANTSGAALVGSPTITAGQGSRLELAASSLILFTGCEL